MYISKGSVATRFGCGVIFNEFCRKCSRVSASERNPLKIDKVSDIVGILVLWNTV